MNNPVDNIVSTIQSKCPHTLTLIKEIVYNWAYRKLFMMKSDGEQT